jgi:hypothetical protein
MGNHDKNGSIGLKKETNEGKNNVNRMLVPENPEFS